MEGSIFSNEDSLLFGPPLVDELPTLGTADPLGVLVFSSEEAILSLSPLENEVGSVFFPLRLNLFLG